MNNQFDELTKAMAQSVTRRAALKKFGVGIAGIALACFGLASKTEARVNHTRTCQVDRDCQKGSVCYHGACRTACNSALDCLSHQAEGPDCWPVPGLNGYTGLCGSSV